MTYLEYESFIHPDVLNAFLIKANDVDVITESESNIGSENIAVNTTDNVFAGDKFLYDDELYAVRTVDTVRKEIITTGLKSILPVGTSITILKEDRRSALKTFYEIGEKDYSTFANSLINSGIPIRFEADVYILKRAFIAMYSWVLQNKAFLKGLNLSGIGIPKSEIYDHFYKLLLSEKDDLEKIRDEALSELARKQQNDADGKGGSGFVAYGRPSRGYFSGYRRR